MSSGQTLLEAIESAGVAWPSSCRVGACGTCRCRVRAGTVHERTESAYLLSAEEIAAGTVLACQTEPRGAVEIESVGAPLRLGAVVEATDPRPATRE